MTDVLLFHHALGLTAGIRAFADHLRADGHTVAVGDLYDGATYESIDDGVAHAENVGFDVIADRGHRLADGLGDNLVVVGFSLGVLPAQKVAQTRPGVAGAVLCHSAVPISVFGDSWPDDVAVQLHMTEHDELAEEDLPAARDLAAATGGELFVYEGHRHLFADPSFTDYDPVQAELLLRRTLQFIDASTGGRTGSPPPA